MIIVESGFTGTTYPLTHPRIGANPATGTVWAPTSAAGFDAAFAAEYTTTVDRWRPTAVPATWQISFTSRPISYCGIAAHDLGTVGATVSVQRWTGSAWSTVATSTPTDDLPLFFLLTKRTTDRFRINITGAIPTIGIIAFGDVTEFPQLASYTGSVAFDKAIMSTFTTNISDGGQFLGRFEKRRGQPIQLAVSNLSETWCDATLAPVLDYMKGAPVFIADRPASYPKSVAFAYSTGPITPQRDTPNASIALSVAMELIGNV